MLRRYFSTGSLNFIRATPQRQLHIASFLQNSNQQSAKDGLLLFENYINDLKKADKDDLKDDGFDDIFGSDKELQLLDDLETSEIHDSYDEQHFFLSKDEENYLLNKGKGSYPKENNEQKIESVGNHSGNMTDELLPNQKRDDIVVSGVGNIYEFLKESGAKERKKRDAEYLKRKKLLDLAKKQGKKVQRMKQNELYSLDSLDTEVDILAKTRTVLTNTKNSSKSKINIAHILEKEFADKKEGKASEADIIMSLAPSNYYFNDLFKTNRELYEPVLCRVISAKLSSFSKKELLEVFDGKGNIKKSLKKKDYVDSIMRDVWNMHLETPETNDLMITKFQLKTDHLRLVKSDPIIKSKIFDNEKKPRYAIAIKPVFGNSEFSDITVIHSKNLVNHFELSKFKTYDDFVNVETVNVKKMKLALYNTVKITSALENLTLKDDDELFSEFLNYLQSQQDCIVTITSADNIVFKFTENNTFENRLVKYIAWLSKNIETEKSKISIDRIVTCDAKTDFPSESIPCDDDYATERPILFKNTQVPVNLTKLSDAVLEKVKVNDNLLSKKESFSLVYQGDDIVTQHNLIPGYILNKEGDLKFNTDTPFLASKLSSLIIKEIDGFKKFQNLNCNLVPYLDEEVVLSEVKGQRIDIKKLSLPNVEFIFDLKDSNDWSKEFVEVDFDSLMVVGALKKETSYLKMPFKEYDFKYLKENYLIFDKEKTLSLHEELLKFKACNLKLLFNKEKVSLDSFDETSTFTLKLNILLEDGVTEDVVAIKYKMSSYQLLTSNHFANTYDDISIFSHINILTSSESAANKKYISVELHNDDNTSNVVMLDRFDNIMQAVK